MLLPYGVVRDGRGTQGTDIKGKESNMQKKAIEKETSSGKYKSRATPRIGLKIPMRKVCSK
jgi:hypothetical protein